MKTVTLADLTEGLEEATIREWYVTEGQQIEKSQPLVAFETAKAIMEAPAPITGTVKQLAAKPGEKVDTQQPLVILIETS